MREGWEIRKLGDLTTALNGLWVGKKPPFVNIAVIRNTNFTKDCQLDTTDIAYIDAEVKHFSTRKLQCGDIIIEKSGGSDKQPVGRPVLFNIPEGDFSFSNFTSTLRINDQSEMLPSFLHKVLWAIYRSGKTASLQSKTTGIRNLDFKSYLKLPIPVPPIAEQEMIVAELDCLTGIIEKKKQQLEELDKLAQSIFYDMFGDPITNEKRWEVKKLEEMVSASCSISYGIVQPGDGELTGVPVVRPVDLRDTYTHNVGLKLTTKEISNAYKRTILKGNELLLCVRGTTGIVSLAAKDLSGCNVSRGISPLEFNSSNNRFFMLYQFKAPSVQMIIADLTHGIALKGMNMADVRKMRLSQPPLDLQNEFAEKIEAIEKQKELVKRSIVETETLFNSRMDYWFN